MQSDALVTNNGAKIELHLPRRRPGNHPSGFTANESVRKKVLAT
jgi:hypothetical protein